MMKTQKARLRELLERIVESFEEANEHVHTLDLSLYQQQLMKEAKELLRNT